MGSIEYGANQAVNKCLKIKKDESVCIITDNETKHIADVLLTQAEKITDNISYFVMEDFGKRGSLSHPLNLPDEIIDSLNKCDVSIYAARSQKGEFPFFLSKVFDIVDNSKIRHAHMTGITDESMRTGMCADYTALKEFTNNIYDSYLKNAKSIRVTTPAGTNLVVEFDKGYRWCVCDGDITSKKWMNLPEGEIFTCPKTVNGTAVIDGVLGAHFDKRYGKIKDTPVTITIKNSRVTNISCNNKALEEELKVYIKTDENSDRVGEFAIGTNTAIKGILGVMLQDEKFPGVHIAFGDSFSDSTGANWKSITHMDCVMLNCTIVIDDKFKLMADGKYLV